MRYLDEYDNPNYQDLHKQFSEQYKTEKNLPALIDIIKHSNTYSIFLTERELNYNRKLLKTGLEELENKNKEQNQASKTKQTSPEIEEVKKEIAFINKLELKILPIFFKKWLENCPERTLIFDLMEYTNNEDPKVQQIYNEAICTIHSIGYIKHYLETVPFADKTFVENSILNGTDYCLKYEYGLHFPNKRKLAISALRKQSEKQKNYSNIIKQYARELSEMKNAPCAEEAKML